MKPLIVPDIGINHGGSIRVAKRMIKAIKLCGGTCVKMQLHMPEQEMSRECKTIKPGNSTHSIWDIINSSNLSLRQHRDLRTYAKHLGLMYICTPFCLEAVDELVKMDVDVIKIGSGEVNNVPLLRKVAKTKIPVILSSGMNTINSVAEAFEIVKPICILHCNSVYPTPFNKVRLGRMEAMKGCFPVSIGYSDHCVGIGPSIIALGMGAQVIEKHFTMIGGSGPDVEVSMGGLEFRELLVLAKVVDKVMSGPSADDSITKQFAFHSIVAKTDIKKGETLKPSNITVKRPGTGIPAREYDSVLGQRAKANIKIDTVIKSKDIQ